VVSPFRYVFHHELSDGLLTEDPISDQARVLREALISNNLLSDAKPRSTAARAAVTPAAIHAHRDRWLSRTLQGKIECSQGKDHNARTPVSPSMRMTFPVGALLLPKRHKWWDLPASRPMGKGSKLLKRHATM